MKKLAIYFSVFFAVVFFIAATASRYFAVFSGALEIVRWLIFLVVASYFIYPILRNLFGVSLTKERWSFKVKISNTSTASEISAYFWQMMRGIYIGCRDFAEFREGLDNVDRVTFRKELFTVLAAFAVCFSFGVINALFPIAFWYVCTKQFDIDFAASVHVASCEIFIGLLTLAAIFTLHPGLWILTIYPVASFLWTVLYFRDKQMNINVALMQVAKVVIYSASKYIPYILLSSFSFPI